MILIRRDHCRPRVSPRTQAAMNPPRFIFRLLTLAAAIAPASGVVIYQESFSGTGIALNGTAEDQQGVLWSANNFVNDNGSINGANEGSALLPFSPLVNQTYSVTLDVTNPTDRWIGLGFARDPLAFPGTSFTNDRLSNETEGIAWMLYRDHASDPTQDIQLFGGFRTSGGIADTNPTFDNATTHTLRIDIDTTGTGASFTANFFLDGVSLLAGGPATISINIEDINYVGFTFDNSTATPITVDNFVLTGSIPEPTVALLGSLGLLTLLRRRRA